MLLYIHIFAPSAIILCAHWEISLTFDCFEFKLVLTGKVPTPHPQALLDCCESVPKELHKKYERIETIFRTWRHLANCRRPVRERRPPNRPYFARPQRSTHPRTIALRTTFVVTASQRSLNAGTHRLRIAIGGTRAASGTCRFEDLVWFYENVKGNKMTETNIKEWVKDFWFPVVKIVCKSKLDRFCWMILAGTTQLISYFVSRLEWSDTDLTSFAAASVASIFWDNRTALMASWETGRTRYKLFRLIFHIPTFPNPLTFTWNVLKRCQMRLAT